MTPSLIETEEKEEALQAIADEGDSPGDDYSGAGSEIANASQTGNMGDSLHSGGGGGGRRNNNSWFNELRNWAERKLGWKGVKELAKKGWRAIRGGGEAVEAVEGAEAATAAGETAAAATTAATGVAAAPAIIIGTAVVATGVVGYAGYKNEQAQNLADDAIRQAGTADNRESHLHYFASHLNPPRDINNANDRAQLALLLDQKIAEQNKIVEDNKSAFTNWIPDWAYLGSGRQNQKDALGAMAPLTAARTELTAYEEKIKSGAVNPARPQDHAAAPAQTQNHAPATAAPVPAQPHAPNRASLPKASTAQETLVVGDSIAHLASFAIGGPKKIFAIDGTHLAVDRSAAQGGHPGENTLAQLDRALAYVKAHPGVQRDLVLHVGRNDVDATRHEGKSRDAYEAKLQSELAPKLKELQASGVHVIWIAPPIMAGEKDPSGVTEMAKVEARVAHAKENNFDYREQQADLHCCPDQMHPSDPRMLVASTMPEKLAPPKAPAASHSEQAANHPNKPSSSSSSSSSGTSVYHTEQQKYAFDLLVKKGLKQGISRQQSEIIAAGFVSNMVAESGTYINPQAVGDGGKAHGIGQWHPDRENAFIQKHGYGLLDPRATVGQQVDFMWDEAFNGAEKKVGQKLLAARNAHEAGAIVSADYERPLARDREATNRGTVAEDMYNHYGSTSDTQLAANTRQPHPDLRGALPSGPTPGGKNIEEAKLEPQRHTVMPHAAAHSVTDG